MSTYTETLGDRIAERRAERGLPQTKLADMVGVTQAAISFWETGRHTPSRPHIVAVAAALDTTAAALTEGLL